MNTSQNSMAIIILCSHLCTSENVKPLEPSEWTKLADALVNTECQPSDILSFSKDDFKGRLNYNSEQIQRIQRLIERSGSVALEIEKYNNMGIGILTRADKNYPVKLKSCLGKKCPPLFYYAGDTSLAERKTVGFVGSRVINKDDENFTENTVQKVVSNGYGIVSGGARGIDLISEKAAINSEGFCIEYISDSLLRKIKQRDAINSIKDNKLLILSIAKPDDVFNTGIALMRNRFIYAQSEGTVVIKADYNKGGSWNGAIDNLEKKWCTGFCWNNTDYKGNQELIRKGAVPIDESWGGEVSEYKLEKTKESVQLSIL